MKDAQEYEKCAVGIDLHTIVWMDEAKASRKFHLYQPVQCAHIVPAFQYR